MSAIVKGLFRVFGVALIIFGGIGSLQGLGILTWPSNSPMIADRHWALYGGLAAGIGAVIILVASRIGR